MRCSNCNAIAKMQCVECHRPLCRFHCNVVFDEDEKSFINLCGACSVKRRTEWVKGKSLTKQT